MDTIKLALELAIVGDDVACMEAFRQPRFTVIQHALRLVEQPEVEAAYPVLVGRVKAILASGKECRRWQ